MLLVILIVVYYTLVELYNRSILLFTYIRCFLLYETCYYAIVTIKHNQEITKKYAKEKYHKTAHCTVKTTIMSLFAA